MNIDDPKLTAFALDELDESEKSRIARAVADSPEAQHYVDETREFARVLKKAFAQSQTETAHPANVISIRDDPWFWSIARPVAIAAMLAIVGVIAAIALSSYKSHRRSFADQRGASDYVVEAEESATPDASSEFVGANAIPNPLTVQSLGRLNRVVVSESSREPNGEMRVIEVIVDNYRLQELRECLLTPVLSKKPRAGVIGRNYNLLFLDTEGGVIAAATFYCAPGIGFVLQPLQHAPQSVIQGFTGYAGTVLPGSWNARLNYSAYAIPFPNWLQSIGYCPGA